MSKRKLTLIIILIGILVEVTWIAGIVSGPVFIEQLGLSNTQLGIALGSMNIGLFLFSPLAGNFIFRLGSSKILFYGLMGMLAGILFIIIGVNFPVLITGMIITGIANAFIINANTTILAELFPHMIRRIVSLYSAIYFGGCALLAPLIGQWLKLSSDKGWDLLAFRMPFLLFFILFIYFLISTHRIVMPHMGRMFKNPEQKLSYKGKKKEKGPHWSWIPFLGFFHGLMYFVLVSWLSPMAKEKFGANEFQGSLFVGAATLGMCIGRFAIAGFKLPWEDRRVLSTGTITGGLLLLAGLFSPLYLPALILIGLGSFIASTSYPCISSLAGERFPETKSKVFGYMYSSYAIAGIVGTPLAGKFADLGFSFSKILTISAFSAIAIGVISLAWKHAEARNLK